MPYPHVKFLKQGKYTCFFGHLSQDFRTPRTRADFPLGSYTNSHFHSIFSGVKELQVIHSYLFSKSSQPGAELGDEQADPLS